MARSQGSRRKAANDPTAGVGAASGYPLAQLMLRVVDTGIAASIFVVPMAMGGRHALGRLALTSISIAIAMAWLVRQAVRGNGTWRRSAAEWLLLAGVVLLVVQLVPLPPALLGHLAPHTSE
ncbi:MAG: hypothetical protein HQ582_18685, partial [Planctomycetes bacterium]|nr:hypothetical protein [Planctomycetota bacterium]